MCILKGAGGKLRHENSSNITIFISTYINSAKILLSYIDIHTQKKGVHPSLRLFILSETGLNLCSLNLSVEQFADLALWFT
jgi:hypothetical protein